MTALALPGQPGVERIPGVSVSRIVTRSSDGPMGPRRIPDAQLIHLRGLFQAYQSALDSTLLSLGYTGGCKVDLQSGVVIPPEGR